MVLWIKEQGARRTGLRTRGILAVMASHRCGDLVRTRHAQARRGDVTGDVVRSKDGTAAYGLLKAYGDPNRRSEERNAWIEYLATESDESVLGPEEVDIHE